MILAISQDNVLIVHMAAMSEAAGHNHEVVPSIENATALVEREGLPEALVLDLDATGEDGFGLCRTLTSTGTLPILVTGTAISPLDRYEAFAAGACDFVGKPLDPLELAMRLRARLGRSHQAAASPTLVLGEARVDLEACEVRIGDRRRALTPHEVAILRHLAAHDGQCVSIEELLVQALGYPPLLGNPEIVRTHIRHLRGKLEPDPSRPRWLLNIPRVGYRIASRG